MCQTITYKRSRCPSCKQDIVKKDKQVICDKAGGKYGKCGTKTKTTMAAGCTNAKCVQVKR